MLKECSHCAKCVDKNAPITSTNCCQIRRTYIINQVKTFFLKRVLAIPPQSYSDHKAGAYFCAPVSAEKVKVAGARRNLGGAAIDWGGLLLDCEGAPAAGGVVSVFGCVEVRGLVCNALHELAFVEHLVLRTLFIATSRTSWGKVVIFYDFQ